jgi:hypothetical protein
MGGKAMTNRKEIELSDLQKKTPDEILAALKTLEDRVRSRLPEFKEEDRSGVPLVDWLVSQVLFVRNAWQFIKTDVHSDEEALWLLEMLSLPECLRRAKRNWQKKRLIEEALVHNNLRWRDVLGCRKKVATVERYPRTPDFNFHFRQLTPYGSKFYCPIKWPNPWGYPRLAEVMLQIRPGIYNGGPLSPIQAGSSISFFIQIFTNNGVLILDQPRTWDKKVCIEQLTVWKDLLDQHLSHLKKESAPHSPLKERDTSVVGLMGWGRALFPDVRDYHSLYQAVERLQDQLRADIERIKQGKAVQSRRARILQKYYAVPFITWFVQVRVLPFDLEPGMMAMVLGAWLSKIGMLSAREKRMVRNCAEQKIYFLNPKVDTDHARTLSSELVKRLGQFDRPLLGKSIHAYVWRFLRRGRFPNVIASLSESENYDEEDIESKRPLKITKRIPKGQRKRLAIRLGCHPKTVDRRYKEYCKKKKVTPCLVVWKNFSKNVLRKLPKVAKKGLYWTPSKDFS